MATRLYGVLLDGLKKPIVNATVVLLAKGNTITVLNGSEAIFKTDAQGAYNVTVQSGYYKVIIGPQGTEPYKAGEIAIYADSQEGSLNNYLVNWAEEDLTPEVIKQVKELVAVSEQYSLQAGRSAAAAQADATDARNSKASAAQSAADALVYKNDSKANADAAKQAQAGAAGSANTANAAVTTIRAIQQDVTASKDRAITAETNAKASQDASANSAGAAKVSETNAKSSETKAKEYMQTVQSLASPLTQYNWPVETSNKGAYTKIAKLTDPRSVNCHLTLMVTNGGNFGSSYGNIDFIEISARGLNDTGEVTSENISKFLSVRRLGSPNLPNSSQISYGLVEGDGYIEVWCYQGAYIKQTKVAVLAQTGNTELYIPEGFVTQTDTPSGFIESPAIRVYDQVNKPSKSDVGLGNVTNDAQVKKSGDTMTGDLDILKETPSIRLKSAKGNAHVWFKNADSSDRGVIYAPENTDTLGEVRIRVKNAKGESSGDFVVRHDGRVEARDLKVKYKISAATAELANTSTNTLENTLKISGNQHTPLLLTRTGYSENLSIGFKVDNVVQKYLGIDGSGDLRFGDYPDHKTNSKVITQAKLDSGVTVGGKTTFSDLATFNAGISGAIEPEIIDGKTINLNDLVIKFSDKGSVKYYQCTSAAGGNAITNKPSGIGGNFLLRVESVRKVSDSDYTNVQTLVAADTEQMYVRYCRSGSWGEWKQDVVSGRNQDVSVKSLAAQKITFGGVTLRVINKDEGLGIGVVFDGSNSMENTFGIVNTGGGSAVFHNYTKPADSSAVNTGVLIGGYGSRPWTGSTYTEHSNVSQHFLMDGVASATNHGGWFRLLTTPLNATVDERRQTFATSNNGDLYTGYDVPMGTYKLDAANYNGLDILNGRGLKQVNNTANEIALITPRNGSTANINFRGVAFNGTMTGTKGATQQGDNLWLSFAGHDGVKFTGAAAGIRIQASTGWSTTSTQCGITFATTAQGSTKRTDRWSITSDGTLSPAQDNTYAIGSSVSRATSIFATNGTIQTSDARMKTDVRKMSDAELSAAKDIAREFGFFQWIERVKTEGDAARWHAGITVQRVISIMTSYGLDPMAYGFVCFDSWEEQEIVSVDPDNQSKTITKIEAGDRYSLRYSELSIFIARGLEQRISELEDKLL